MLFRNGNGPKRMPAWTIWSKAAQCSEPPYYSRHPFWTGCSFPSQTQNEQTWVVAKNTAAAPNIEVSRAKNDKQSLQLLLQTRESIQNLTLLLHSATFCVNNEREHTNFFLKKCLKIWQTQRQNSLWSVAFFCTLPPQCWLMAMSSNVIQTNRQLILNCETG